MKNIFLKISFLFTFILIISNNGFAQSAEYIQDNIAIINIGSVENNETGTSHYTLTLKDFSGGNNLPEGFGLAGLTFTDNGKYNDVRARDRVYTAMEPIASGRLKGNSIKTTVYYNDGFKHVDKLNKAVTKMSSTSGSTMPAAGIKLRPCGCPCPDGTCPACEWWGLSCWEIVEIEIPFPWE